MAKANVAMAIAAHPDDIEFGMAGTLLLLRAAGWEVHYLNLASGNCGSATMSPARTRATRRREAQAAARSLGAVFHPPLVDDLEIFYEDGILRRLAAVIREVRPSVLLTQSPEDYMEDHMNTSRLTVTAAFARGMPNYRTRPLRRAYSGPTVVYHALPHGLRDGLGKRIIAEAYVDTSAVHEKKRLALACHTSQKAWLDASQGMDSYLKALDAMSAEVGRMSGVFAHAEGWRRHSHLGFCAPDANPLGEALPEQYRVNRGYKKSLDAVD